MWNNQRTKIMNQNRLSFEECRAIYADPDTLLVQPKPLYRLNGHNAGRFYYAFDENNNPDFYVSVTTLIKQAMPTSPYLIKWIAEMGHAEAEQYKFERANYGTFMHMQIQTLLINRTIDLDMMGDDLLSYMKENGVPVSLFDGWIDDMRKDILSFAQFMIDNNVRPIAIEMVLAHPDGYAGALDLVCELEIEEKGFFGEVLKSGPNKGQPKETKMTRRVFAIVDFKSGRKGFFPEHEIQLELYRRLLRKNFPHLVNEHFHLLNWSPKDWRTAPSYNLTDQTESKQIAKADHIIAIGKIENAQYDKRVVNIRGVLDLDRGVAGNIEQINLDTLVKRLDDERKNQITTGIDAEFDARIGDDREN